MQVLAPSQQGRTPGTLVLATSGLLFGAVLVVFGGLLAYAAFATSAGGLLHVPIRPTPAQTVVGVLSWALALIAPSLFVIAGLACGDDHQRLRPGRLRGPAAVRSARSGSLQHRSRRALRGLVRRPRRAAAHRRTHPTRGRGSGARPRPPSPPDRRADRPRAAVLPRPGQSRAGGRSRLAAAAAGARRADEADALLLITAADRPGSAPGKLFEYLGAGRPILGLTAGSFAEEIIRGTRSGWTVDPGDRDGIAGLLRGAAAGELTLAGIAPDRERIAEYSRERLIGQLDGMTLRWRGRTITPLDVVLPRRAPSGIRTEEDTIELIRRLGPHYSDDTIAAILNRQGRKSATGERFTAIHVGVLRRYRKIPRFQPPAEPRQEELVTIRQAAKILGLAPSTLHRCLNDGFIAGEQMTPGAPWRIRMTEELRARFVERAPPGYLPMLEATLKLRVSRQTVLQRVKRGELEALHVGRGRRTGLRIKVVETQPGLFEHIS